MSPIFFILALIALVVLVGAVLGKLSWDRAVMFLVVIAIVIAFVMFIPGLRT